MTQGSRQLADVSYLQVTAEHAAQLKSQSRAALGLLPGAAVLDVGCGAGGDVHALAAAGAYRVVGVDADPSMLATARLATASDTCVAFICADASWLPFPEGIFDAVHSDRMLQHIADPAAAVCEMARVTRSGGRLVLTDTDWASLTIAGTGDPATEQLLTALLIRQVAASPTAGRDLPSYTARAPAQVFKVSKNTFTTADAALLRHIAHLDLAEDAALAAGLMNAAELATWQSRLAFASGRRALSCSLTVTTVLAVRL
jgi:ubiquinone/menaquinone biosynthesis C-methylase UbiE